MTGFLRKVGVRRGYTLMSLVNGMGKSKRQTLLL